MNKKLLIPAATLLSVFGFANIADAHNASANGTCNGGVTWQVTNYDKNVVNTIVVRVDGVVRWQDLDFKSSDEGTIATDKTVAHTWSVVVNAPGTDFDRNLTGSYVACQTVPTTTTSVPATTTTVTSTTVPVTTEPATTVPETHPPTTPAPEFPQDTTTTSVVAVDEPPVPTTIAGLSSDIPLAPPTAEPVLPRTGNTTNVAGWYASILVLSGFGLLAIAAVRRRHPQ